MNKNNIKPIKIAIFAVGGDGGGVLSNWIVNLAIQNGYWAQSTSIAGVAQRTGSTIYYIELVNLKDITLKGKIITPVLSQMPAPQDLDIAIATEIIEAGRAIFRNFISQHTTLIFSTHRNLAIREKENPSDGISDGTKIIQNATQITKECLFGNFRLIADKNKSVISASMFGALAASQKLPFKKQDFIDTIKKDGVAIQTNIANFNDVYDYVEQFKKSPQTYSPTLQKAPFKPMPASHPLKKINDFIHIIKNDFPQQLHAVLFTGVCHLSDWQNTRWATTYLNKVKSFIIIDNPQKNYLLSQTLAQYLATAMAYDDMVFVADQKTRAQRLQQVRNQVEANSHELVKILDYLHPSFHEFVGFLPKTIGLKLSQNKKFEHFFHRYLDSDRRMYSTNLFNFLVLYFIGGMKKWRMITLRHHQEMQNIHFWLQRIQQTLPIHYDLAVLLAKTYRLKKGYGDTYARGHSKFSTVNDFIINAINTSSNHSQTLEKAEYLFDICLQQNNLQDIQKTAQQLSQ